MKFYAPSSFSSSDPVNIIATTLGQTHSPSGYGNAPGVGYALAFAQNGGHSIDCDLSPSKPYEYAILLTQSAIGRSKILRGGKYLLTFL